MEGSRERSDAEQEDRLVRAGRFNVVEEALSVSLPPYLILSDTVLSLWCQLARRFLSQSLSLTLSATLASTLVRLPLRVPTG